MIKNIPKELNKEGAFMSEDQIDEREFVACRRTSREKMKGA